MTQTRTLFFPFGFYCEVRRAKQRAPRPGRFRADTGVLIESVDAADLVTAYLIEEPEGRRRRCHPVYLHGGRFWWPLHNPRTPRRDERAILEDARAGVINLFGDDVLGDLNPIDGSIVATGASDEENVRTQTQKKAQDLLLVDGDRLFAAGGAPIFVRSHRRLRIVSTGADRCGEPATSGISLQPGHHGKFWADWAICGGECWRPGSPELAAQILRLRCGRDRVPVVEQRVAHHDVRSEFEQRLDASFRLADFQVCCCVDERPTGYDDLFELFARARADGPPDLTARRLAALEGCVKTLGEGWVINTFPLGRGNNMLRLLKDAAAEAWTEAGLTDEDGEALADIAGL